jgi:phage terminase large subunit-like protein
MVVAATPAVEMTEAERGSLNALDDAGMRLDLAAFVRGAWHIIEPGRPLKWNWHLTAICKVLEAMLRGELRDLLITIPPGTTKSRIIAVFFPAWVWINHPDKRFLFVSNSDENATRDSMACRRIIESDWYRDTFKPTWALQEDQNQKTWYETTRGGHRNCMGIHSSITGKKGDFVIVDDANDAETVNSEAERKRVNSKFDNAISDRVNDFQTGCRIIVGQRTHANDLIGHVKAKYGFQEMYIPEEFQPARRGRVVGLNGNVIWEDRRKRPSELLRPTQFDRAMVNDYKRTRLTQFKIKHNGDPRNEDGTRFKPANFGYWRRDGEFYVMPAIIVDGQIRRTERRFLPVQILHKFGIADGAASAKRSADYTVMSSFLVSPWFDLLWIGCKRFQAEIPEQPAILVSESKRHGLEFVGIETTASNVALYQYSSREEINVKRFTTRQRDKLARAVPAIMFTEAYRLYLPDAGEVHDFPVDDVVNELKYFTGNEKEDAHDDIVDTLSYGVEWVTGQYPDDVPRASTQVGVGGLDFGYGGPRREPGRTVLDVPKPGLPGLPTEEIVFPEFRKNP